MCSNTLEPTSPYDYRIPDAFLVILRNWNPSAVHILFGTNLAFLWHSLSAPDLAH